MAYAESDHETCSLSRRCYVETYGNWHLESRMALPASYARSSISKLSHLNLCRFTSNTRSLVQSYSSGCAMYRFAHAPLMPSDIEGYGVAAQMARRIDRMRVSSE